MTRIVLTGGGSGGHIYPLIAVADALKVKAAQLGTGIDLQYLGYVGDYRAELEAHDITVHSLVGGKLRRYASIQNIFDIPKFFIGFFQAIIKLFFLMPEVIFSKGGTGALPVILAGWFYRIPVVIHESDSIPGLNNAVGGRFAKRVAVAFKEAQKYFAPEKVVLVGSPLRQELLQARTIPQADAKAALGFETNKPLVVVLGGSQGSQRLNNLILVTLPQLTETEQVLHQTGSANFKEVEALSRAAILETPATPGHLPMRYQPLPYLDVLTLGTALTAADLIVTRSGSNIFEFAAFGKPAILIPLQESANNHQRENAYAFSEAGGGGVVIEEANLLPDIFLAQIKATTGNPETWQRMAAASKAFFQEGAAEAIADEIIALA